MSAPSREYPEPICPPELDYNLLEASQKLYESTPPLRLVTYTMDVKYPPVPKTKSNGEPFDDPREAWIFPVFPAEAEKNASAQDQQTDSVEK